MNRKLIIAPVLALAIAGAGAGCGGSDSNDFVESYNEATAPLQELTTGLGGAAAGGPGSEAELTKLADGLDDVRKRLAGLEPPDGAQEELDSMLGALDATAADVRQIAKDAKSGDVEALTAAASDLASTGGALVAAEEKLRIAVEG